MRPAVISASGSMPVWLETQEVVGGSVVQFKKAPHVTAKVLRAATGVVKWARLASMLASDGRRAGFI